MNIRMIKNLHARIVVLVLLFALASLAAALPQDAYAAQKTVQFAKVDMSPDMGAAVSKDGYLYLWGSNMNRIIFDSEAHGTSEPQRVMGNVVDVAIDYRNGAVYTVTADSQLWRLGEADYDGCEWHVEVGTNRHFIMSGVKQVDAADGSIIALKTDGTVWTWGSNIWANGFGTNDELVYYENSFAPKKVASNAKWVGVSCENYAYITKSDVLYMWGGNKHGQLGDGTRKTSKAPKQVMANVKKAALAQDTNNSIVLAVKNDGTVWSWGQNFGGQLGTGENSWDDALTPQRVISGAKDVAVNNEGAAAVLNDDSLWLWGFVGSTECMAPRRALAGVSSVALGNYVVAAVTKDGVLKTWGPDYDGAGLLADAGFANAYDEPAKILQDAVSLDSGGLSTVAVRNDGTLWIWGKLGETVYAKPEKIASEVRSAAVSGRYDDYTVLYVKTDGTLCKWNGREEQIARGVSAVAAGGEGYYSALTTDGRLLASAASVEGSATVNYKSVSFDIQSPVDENGYSYNTGETFYQLATGVKVVACGIGCGAYVKTDGTLWTYGKNYFACLGSGKESDYDTWNAPTKVMAGVKDVKLADSGSCRYVTAAALKTDGTVWAWGYDGHGMGSGGQETPKKIAQGAKSIAADTYCRIAYTDGKNVCYSYGANGAEGTLDSKFVQILKSVRTVEFGSEGYLYWVDAAGTVYSSGESNVVGQLGNGKSSYRTSPGTVSVTAEGAIKVKAPTGLDKKFTYNGSTHEVAAPVVPGYTATGTTSAKDPGFYKIALKLWKGYQWSDGSGNDKVFEWKIARKAVKVPTGFKKRFAYDGKAHRLAVPKSEGYVVSGKVSAKKPGTYKAKLKLRKGYCWSGGSTKVKTVKWKIVRKSNAGKLRAASAR